MTKIIIDGVDVSKCCWCDFEPNTEPYCRINDGEDLDCEDNPDCNFKKLKRAEQKLQDKEQECEKLNLANERLVAEKYNLNEEIEKWKHQAELGSNTVDRLAEQLQVKEQQCETLKSENFTFEELVKTQEELIDKLKQALDEIEEFCKQNHYCLESEYRWFSNEIQDIIKKAKE